MNLLILIPITMLSLMSITSMAGQIVIEGYYNGRNLYIQNPKVGDGKYCISSISVNNKVVSVPNSSAFDLDLSHLRLKEVVVVTIQHSDDCTPKIINLSVLHDRETFTFNRAYMSDNALHWLATGEKVNGKYFIQKKEFDEWRTEKVLDANGSASGQYQYLPRHHSGTNHYRVRYMDPRGNSFYSNEIVFQASFEKVTFYPTSVMKDIRFTREVKYEILNNRGEMVMAGVGDSVDCSTLRSGTYLVRYDNSTGSFFKK